MVGVGGVVVRAERDAEIAARAVNDAVQEGALCALVVPILKNRDGAAVLEREAGDVDSICFRMLAASVTAGDVAAAIRAEVVNLGYAAAEPVSYTHLRAHE